MDQTWDLPAMPGSILCLFCRGYVQYTKVAPHRFRNHLQNHHGVFYHHEVIIALNRLGLTYVEKLVADWESSEERSVFVGDDIAETELEEAPDATYIKHDTIRQNFVKIEQNVQEPCNKCGAVFGSAKDLKEHDMNDHVIPDQEGMKRKIEERKRKYLENRKLEILERKRNEEILERERKDGEIERGRLAEIQQKKEVEQSEKLKIEQAAREWRYKIEAEAERKKQQDEAKAKAIEENERSLGEKRKLMGVLAAKREVYHGMDIKRKSIDKSDLMEKIKKLRESVKQSKMGNIISHSDNPPMMNEIENFPTELFENISENTGNVNDNITPVNYSTEAGDKTEVFNGESRTISESDDNGTISDNGEEDAISDDENIAAIIGENELKNKSRLPDLPIVFKCSVCRFEARKNIELKMHIRSKHKQMSDIAFLTTNTSHNGNNEIDPIKKGLNIESNEDYSDDESKADTKNDTIGDDDSNCGDTIDPPIIPKPPLRNMTVREIVASSPYFSKYKNQIKNGTIGDFRYNMTDPTMPPGWKYRETGRGDSLRKDKEFLSQDGLVFRSRKAAFEYMKFTGEYDLDDLEKAEKKKI